MAEQRRFKIGDRVRIESPRHPWDEHYGRVAAPAKVRGFDWEIDIESGVGGPRAGVRESDLVAARDV